MRQYKGEFLNFETAIFTWIMNLLSGKDKTGNSKNNQWS